MSHAVCVNAAGVYSGRPWKARIIVVVAVGVVVDDVDVIVVEYSLSYVYC